MQPSTSHAIYDWPECPPNQRLDYDGRCKFCNEIYPGAAHDGCSDLFFSEFTESPLHICQTFTKENYGWKYSAAGHLEGEFPGTTCKAPGCEIYSYDDETCELCQMIAYVPQFEDLQYEDELFE